MNNEHTGSNPVRHPIGSGSSVGRAAARRPRVSGSIPFPSTNGAVAEVVAKAYSAWSEKPETPVRVRSVPQQYGNQANLVEAPD